MDLLTVVSHIQLFKNRLLKLYSSLGAVVILTLSSISPFLRHLVPDIVNLQTLAIDNIKPWASPNSSLEAVVSIIQDMQKKQRMLATA